MTDFSYLRSVLYILVPEVGCSDADIATYMAEVFAVPGERQKFDDEFRQMMCDTEVTLRQAAIKCTDSSYKTDDEARAWLIALYKDATGEAWKP